MIRSMMGIRWKWVKGIWFRHRPSLILYVRDKNLL